MPKPLGIDREQVRATFLATGSLTEAARLHGLKEATVRQWAKRHKWETVTNALKLRKKADEIIEVKREMGHKDVVEVSLSSDALAQHLSQTHRTFRTNIASALSESSEALAGMDGDMALRNARRMLDLATAASKIFPDMSDANDTGAKLQVNILGLGADALMKKVS
jgi:phosphoserine phosphatase